jgi:hypothetical protein
VESAAEIELDIVGNFRHVQDALSGTSTDSYFLHQEVDEWQRELESLQRDVAQLEANK